MNRALEKPPAVETPDMRQGNRLARRSVRRATRVGGPEQNFLAAEMVHLKVTFGRQIDYRLVCEVLADVAPREDPARAFQQLPAWVHDECRRHANEQSATRRADA
jgi:hypothetical protein